MMLSRVVLLLGRQLSRVLHQDLFCTGRRFRVKTFVASSGIAYHAPERFLVRVSKLMSRRLDLFRTLRQLKTPDSPTPPFDTLKCGRRSITEEGSWARIVLHQA